jgi:lincosamide and streptogramin A transport system ATP-binding/permease protein
LYRPFETLSGGERVKGLLAALFLRANHFLLIDEPTNHLDAHGRRALGAYLRQKRGFILISHDRTLLDACTDHTLSINRASIEVIAGNFSTWGEQKQRQDSYELDRNEVLQKDIQRLTQTAREKADWSDKVEATKLSSGDRGRVGHLAAKAMKRSKSIVTRYEREIDEKSQLLKNIDYNDDLKIHPLQFYTDKLVEFDHVSLFYGETRVCEDLSFQLRQGERLAITGKNGSGKSSVLRLIRGEEIAHSGNVHIGSRLVISYVPQDTSFLRGNLSDYASSCGIDESLFKAILRKLDFSRVQFEKDMADFSSGQKKKALLARSLCEQAHLYLWDEPLNFIDVFSRMQIERLIQTYRPAMLFVEHDAAFCANVGTGSVGV